MIDKDKIQVGDVVEVALISEDKLKLWPTMEQLIGKTATVQRKGHQLELYFPEPISVPGFKEEQYEFIFDAHEIRIVKPKVENTGRIIVEDGKTKIFDENNVLRMQFEGTPQPFGQFDTEEKLTNKIEEVIKPSSIGPIKSDGGSSSYYDLPLMGDLLKEIDSRRVGDISYIKTEELIQTVFKNNFSFGTLFKSLIRAQSVVDGIGKAGNDLEYECNKIIYYANQIKELYGNK